MLTNACCMGDGRSNGSSTGTRNAFGDSWLDTRSGYTAELSASPYQRVELCIEHFGGKGTRLTVFHRFHQVAHAGPQLQPRNHHYVAQCRLTARPDCQGQTRPCTWTRTRRCIFRPLDGPFLPCRSAFWLASPRQYPAGCQPRQRLLVLVAGTHNPRGPALVADRQRTVTHQPTPPALPAPFARVRLQSCIESLDDCAFLHEVR